MPKKELPPDYLIVPLQSLAKIQVSDILKQSSLFEGRI